ncbi:MAG: hypothetical protein RTV41_12060 [Candidatus Thorarchaeota archaeon]
MITDRTRDRRRSANEQPEIEFVSDEFFSDEKRYHQVIEEIETYLQTDESPFEMKIVRPMDTRTLIVEMKSELVRVSKEINLLIDEMENIRINLRAMQLEHIMLDRGSDHSFVDVKAQGFKIMLEERFQLIDGLLCVFATIVDKKQEFTIIVENGRSVDLMERVIEELIVIHKEFPDVTYDFEIEEINLVDLDDYDKQELVLDCRGVSHGHNATIH